MFDMFHWRDGGVGLGGGLITLVWMCFEDDVTCTHACLAKDCCSHGYSTCKCRAQADAATEDGKKEHACNIDRLLLYVKSWIFRNNATKDLWPVGELCCKAMRHWEENSLLDMGAATKQSNKTATKNASHLKPKIEHQTRQGRMKKTFWTHTISRTSFALQRWCRKKLQFLTT